MQQRPAKTQEEAMQKSYQFWSTQPVPKMGKLLNNFASFDNRHSNVNEFLVGYLLKHGNIILQVQLY